MFFSKLGEYPASGMYSAAHFIILAICISLIILFLALCKGMNQETVRKMLGAFGIIFVFLEACKITFVIYNYGVKAYNAWIPLYFCSIYEFAALLSGYCKKTFQKIGDSFVSFGGIVAGISFLICPSTSIAKYPWFHFITIHSFLLHSCMVFSGFLLLLTRTYVPNIKDIWCYSSSVFLFTFLALIINLICGSNLMFISQRFTTVSLLNFLWDLLGPNVYGIVITLAQTFGLFYVAYGVYKIVKKVVDNKELRETSMRDGQIVS